MFNPFKKTEQPVTVKPEVGVPEKKEAEMTPEQEAEMTKLIEETTQLINDINAISPEAIANMSPEKKSKFASLVSMVMKPVMIIVKYIIEKAQKYSLPAEIATFAAGATLVIQNYSAIEAGSFTSAQAHGSVGVMLATVAGIKLLYRVHTYFYDKAEKKEQMETQG